MRKLSLGFVVLFLVHLGASAPESPMETKRSASSSQTSKTQRSVSALVTPQGLGDQIIKFFGKKSGKEPAIEKSGNVTQVGAAATQAIAGKPAVRAASTTTLKKGYVPPPPTPRVSTSQIRQEIQKIFELNKKIKNVKSGRSVQLQRVQEQARIHQKILDELETSQKQERGETASSKNALLAQEKLRIIHEETQRNAKTIEDLNDASSKKVPVKKAPTKKAPAKKAPAKTGSKVTPKAKPAAS